MNRIEKLINELCPNGVEYKILAECSSIVRGERVTKKDLIFDGKYPVISGGTKPLGYINKSNRNKNTITIAQYGSAGYVDYQTNEFWANDVCYSVFPNEILDNKYLYYCLKNKQKFLYSLTTKAIPNHLPLEKLKLVEIPVPPMEVQCEIIHILDKFTLLTAELTAELTERKKQYGYYRDKLLIFNESYIKTYELGEISLVTKLAGFEFTEYVEYSNEGELIALRGLNVKNGKLDLTDIKYIDNSDLSKLNRSKLYIGDMLFTYVGTVGQVALVDKNDKYYLAPNVALIRCNQEIIKPEYLKYYFQCNKFWNEEINRLVQSSSMKNIPMEKIRKFKINVPSLEIQSKIIHVLINFESICEDLKIGLPAEIEMRKKQYEYYRDKLLSFK